MVVIPVAGKEVPSAWKVNGGRTLAASSSPLWSSSSSLNLGYINAFSLYIPLKNLNPQTPDLENQALELSRNPPMYLFRFHRLWIFNINLKNENRWSIMFVPSIQIGKKIERSVDITWVLRHIFLSLRKLYDELFGDAAIAGGGGSDG